MTGEPITVAAGHRCANRNHDNLRLLAVTVKRELSCGNWTFNLHEAPYGA